MEKDSALLSATLFLSAVLVGCDAHLSVRRDLYFSESTPLSCIEKAVLVELPDAEIEKRSSSGEQFWRVRSDRCSFNIDWEESLADGKSAKALVFSESFVTDGFFRWAGKSRIRQAESCLEKIKPAVETRCGHVVRR